jgi:hypothetical protein
METDIFSVICYRPQERTFLFKGEIENAYRIPTHFEMPFVKTVKMKQNVPVNTACCKKQRCTFLFDYLGR